jgi:hypothetical protein
VIALGPDDEPTSDPIVPEFRILPNSGMLVSARQWEGGLVRVQLVGAPEKCGHSHEDKGSFILEAHGDALAIDRGIGSYYDARSHLYAYATAHNLLTPVQADGSEPHQINPAATPIVPHGRGDDCALDASLDCTSAWGGLFRRHQRRIHSETPALIVIEDEAVLPAAGQVVFHFHSLFPIFPEDGGFRVQGDHVVCVVEPVWKCTVDRCEVDGQNGAGREVWHLALRSGTAVEHRLVTSLRIAR